MSALYGTHNRWSMKEYDKAYVNSNPSLMANLDNLKDIIIFKTISRLIEWTTEISDNKTIHRTAKVEIQISKESTSFILTDEETTKIFIDIDISKLISAIDFVIKQKEMETVINFVTDLKQKI